MLTYMGTSVLHARLKLRSYSLKEDMLFHRVFPDSLSLGAWSSVELSFDLGSLSIGPSSLTLPNNIHHEYQTVSETIAAARLRTSGG